MNQLSLKIIAILFAVGVIASSSVVANENNEFERGPWVCSARVWGYDRHGLHTGSGNTQDAASNNAVRACELFHFPGACVIDHCKVSGEYYGFDNNDG